MREFHVTCTTCHAPLRVRDPSLVGQIVACPKCGSMVLIEAPASPAPPAPAAPVAGPTAHVEPPGKLGAPTAKPEHPGASHHASSAASGSAATSPSPFDSADFDAALTSHAATARPVVREGAAAPVADSPPETPAQDAVAEQPTGLRKVLLIAGAGLAGVVLALGLALAAIAIFARTDKSPSGGGTSGKDVASAPDQSSGPASPGVAAPSTSNGSSTDSTSGASPSPGNVPTPGPDNPPTPGTVVPDEPGKTPVKTAPPTGSSPEKPEKPNAVPGATVVDPERPKPAEKTDPAGKPADSDTAGKPAGTPIGRPDPAGPPTFAPKPLEERVAPKPIAGAFSRLLPGAIPPAEKPGETTTPADTPPPEIPAAPPGTPDENSAPPGVNRPRPREIDVQARLADPIAQLDFPGIPLADYVQLLSDLSTVPMTLDADALRLRRVDPWVPVHVKAQDTTVRGALAEAVQTLKLGLVIHESGVLITHPVAAESTRRTVAHDLSDLDRGDDAEREHLVQTITECIASDQWEEAGGANTWRWENGKLTIEADEAVHFDVLLLCDKLRVARKLTPRGKYALSLLTPGSVATRARKALDASLTLNFNRPTHLAEIVSRFGKTGGIRVLIDWHELTGAGWTTETTATLSIENQTLAQSLDQLLTPRELTYRVLDDATLQITTATAAEQRMDIELHATAGALKADGDPQTLLERLYDKLGSRRFRAFGGKGVLRFDPASRCVVALLPWRQQVELARALAETPGPTPASE